MTTQATTGLTCRLCHRAPAEVFTIRRHVGMLLLQRFVKFKGPLCRDHAQSVTKDFLKKTLVQGWWGYISFFVNFFVIGTDLLVLSKAKKLPPPQPLGPGAGQPGAALPPPPPPPPSGSASPPPPVPDVEADGQ